MEKLEEEEIDVDLQEFEVVEALWPLRVMAKGLQYGTFFMLIWTLVSAILWIGRKGL